jgi:hypothetical protein
MSQLLSYYKLCPITNEIVGIAEDAQKSSIICTLGKKIVYILRVSLGICFNFQALLITIITPVTITKMIFK